MYLTGEISNYRYRPNTHQYFSLKDDNAKISAVMFKYRFRNIKFKPEEGMKVLVVGHISVYEPNGSYQIYIDSMEPAGIGQLYQAYEQLKKKLYTEGLFNAPKKKLNKFPKRIAVVTSRSGAVIRDIITTTRRRYPIAQIVLFPAIVQGNEASKSIINQINRVNEIGDFDTLIIGRGGGSIEDLWPFNEEKVAYAIYNSHIPIISSVGHETDTTIADLVADVRAATPTAAAEIAVPVLSDELNNINNNYQRIVNAFNNRLNFYQQKLNQIDNSYVFTQPERLYETYIQQVDYLIERLKNSYNNQLSDYKNNLNQIVYNLNYNSPNQLIEYNKHSLQMLKQKLNHNITQIMHNKEEKLDNEVNSLDNLSPLKIMSRGYTYTTNNKNELIKSIRDVKVNDSINLNFKDGKAKATINKIDGGNKK